MASRQPVVTRVIIVVVAMAAGVVACGDGDGSTITVTAQEWQFGPNTWTVLSGESIEVEFTNRGNLTHEWTIVAGTVSSEAGYDPASVLFTSGLIKPGDTHTGTLQAPGPGTYTVGCFIPGHFDAGMMATLTVRDAGGG